MGFVLLSSCFALTFFQFFFTLPLFYRQVHQLSEAQIGLLLALNGLVDRYGFGTLWWIGGLLAWLTALGFYLLVKKL